MSTLETRARNNRRSIDGEWIRENETRIRYGYDSDEEYSYQDEMRTMTDEAEAINKLLDSIELDEDLFDEKEDEKLVEEVSEVDQILDSTEVPEIQFEDEKTIQEEIDNLNETKARITSMKDHLNSIFASDDYDHDFTTGRSR
ncbi:MAG: hypothetical protein IKN87_02735 [Bacilli bacterium]|nr:hypothetical protein [Bacilli bacterium]